MGNETMKDDCRAAFKQLSWLKMTTFEVFRAGWQAALATSSQSGELPAWFSQFLTNVCEIPGRNSPEDEPEAIVATLRELRNCAKNAIEQYREAQQTTRSPNESHRTPRLAVNPVNSRRAIIFSGKP